MRILYGIAGVGMGHATRSKVSISHLLRRGHDVLAACSDEAYSMFAPWRPERALRIEGLSIRCTGGEFDLRRTLEDTARRLASIMRENAVAWQEAERFRPDAVIGDYEWFAWAFARAHGLPILSIDNAQLLNRCLHNPSVLEVCPAGFQLLAGFTESVAPDCNHYIITSVASPTPTVRPEFAHNTTLIPPILKDAVVRKLAETTRGPRIEREDESGPVLMYKTSVLDDESFLDVLASIPEARFIVYGLTSTRTPPNVTAKPVDEASFLADLASSRAVVSTGGMTLMGEAVAFGKPVFSVPVRGQYEQVFNGRYLELSGAGEMSPSFDPARLRGFLERVPRYRAALRAAPRHDANAKLFATLDALFPSALLPPPFRSLRELPVVGSGVSLPGAMGRR